MNHRLFRLRRMGVAAIAGVTALGAAATIGEGVAGAASTIVTAVSGVTNPAPANIIGNNATGAAGGSIAFAMNQDLQTNEQIVLTLPCSATLQFNPTAGTSTASSTTATTQTYTATASVGAGCAVDNVLTVKNTTGTANAAATTLTVVPNYVTAGATSGAVTLTGTLLYIPTVGGTTATASAALTVPSGTTVVNVALAAAAPVASLAPATANAAISNLTMTVPFATPNPLGTTYPVGVCIQLPTGVTFNAISGAPAVTQSNGAASATVAPLGTAGAVTTSTAPVAVSNGYAEFEIQSLGTYSATVQPSFLISNLHVDVQGTVAAGPIVASVFTAAVTAGTTTLSCTPVAQLAANQTVATVSATPGAAIYGANAEATAAAEYDAAVTKYVAGTGTTCTNNGNVVLATAADPYDALAAAYLESALHTGVLITPVSTTGAIDPATLQALQYSGVQRVYVVGGALAVTQAEINTLAATPAWQCGGLVKTGSNLVVYPAISGATAEQTASAINTYASTFAPAQSLPSIAAAYATATTYNQTTGNASAVATTAATPKTAFVVSSTDWQDADAVAPIAYKYNVPVILTTGNALSATAQSELLTMGINQVIAVGGQLALQPAVVSSMQALNISVLRVAGADYTQTAADIAMFEGKVLGWAQGTLYVAQGTSAGNGWGDSLAAAPLAGGASGNMGGILLTVSPTAGEGQYTDAVLKLAGTAPLGLGVSVTSTLQVLGGPLAISAATTTSMLNALAGK